MADQQPPPPGPPGGYGGPGYYAQQPPPQKKRGCGRAVLIALGVLALLIVVGIVAAIAGGDDDDDGDTATDDTTEGSEAPSASADDDSADDDDAADVEGESDEIDDVTVDTCRNDPAVDWAAASGTATNDSSETSTYLIELNIVDSSGTIVGNASSSVENVPAGGNATWEALSTVALPEGGSCVLISVDRIAA